MKINLKPSYKLIQEKPDLCGPASIEMILKRNGINYLDQQEIAKDLDVKILKKSSKYLSVKLTITENPKDAGIDLKEFKGRKMNNFLKKHKLDFKAKVFYINEIPDVKSFIETNLKQKNDLIINFHTRLFNIGTNFGHYALISAIENNQLIICDPEKIHKSFWQASIIRLVKSMSNQFDGKERGFIVFYKSTNLV